MKKTSQNIFDLTDKVCVVIGGAGLIGSEFARRCALHEATVVLADVDEKKGKALAKKIGATFFECDATNSDSVRNLAERVQEKFGKVDGVVNAVYPRTGSWGTSFEDISYDDFIHNVGMQTGPQFLTAREFGALMKKRGGSIVFVGSIYGICPPRFEIYKNSAIKPPVAEYAIAKGGLWTLTRYLAKYYGPYGIRVNMISPGGIEDKQDAAFKEKFNAHAVLGNRMATSKDISPALAFLLSDASVYITGQNIVIDGGWTL